MSAVFRHELRNGFHALTTYLFGAGLLAFIGLWAMMYNLRASVSNFEFVLGDSCLAFVVIAPILTMRVLAEERRQRTDQLLYALPVSTTEVILGKYAALICLYLVPLAIILPEFFGVKGVYLAESVADATAAICCMTIFMIFFPKILAKGSGK